MNISVSVANTDLVEQHKLLQKLERYNLMSGRVQ